MFLEILEHDVLMTDCARLSPGSTRLNMPLELHKGPSILTMLAHFRSPGTVVVFMLVDFLRFDHELAHLTLDLVMELFLDD